MNAFPAKFRRTRYLVLMVMAACYVLRSYTTAPAHSLSQQSRQRVGLRNQLRFG